MNLRPFAKKANLTDININYHTQQHLNYCLISMKSL